MTEPRVTYAEYIRSEKWRAVRKWALERADYRCQVCNASGHMNVHHRTYDNLGHEHPGDVIVLCSSCHELYHFPHDVPLIEQVEELIALLTWDTLNNPEPWIHRVLRPLKQIKHQTRRDALERRVIAALDGLDPTDT